MRPRIASTSSASDASSGRPVIWISESREPARTRRTSPASASIGRITQRRISSPGHDGADDRERGGGDEEPCEARPDVVEIVRRGAFLGVEPGAERPQTGTDLLELSIPLPGG